MREAGRLETSIKAALETNLPVLVFLHYPPVYGDYICREILDVLQKYNITTNSLTNDQNLIKNWIKVTTGIFTAQALTMP